MSIPLLLALALPVQDASALEPVPFVRGPEEDVQHTPPPNEPVGDDPFAAPELQESAVPS